jgi:hypothetical protein
MYRGANQPNSSTIHTLVVFDTDETRVDSGSSKGSTSAFAALSQVEWFGLRKEITERQNASGMTPLRDVTQWSLTYCAGRDCRLSWRKVAMSFVGALPKNRLYSRLNCEALTYPTRWLAVPASIIVDNMSRLAS